MNDKTGKGLRVWALLGPHRGDNNQILALAEALGLPFEEKWLQLQPASAAPAGAAGRDVRERGGRVPRAARRRAAGPDDLDGPSKRARGSRASAPLGRQDARRPSRLSANFAAAFRSGRADAGISGARRAQRGAHPLRAQPRTAPERSTQADRDLLASLSAAAPAVPDRRTDALLATSRRPRCVAAVRQLLRSAEAARRLGDRGRKPAKPRPSCSPPVRTTLECSKVPFLFAPDDGPARLSGADRGRRRDLRHRRQRGDDRRRGEDAESRSESCRSRRARSAGSSWRSSTVCGRASGCARATFASSGQSLEEHGFGGTIDAPRASDPPDFTAEIAERVRRLLKLPARSRPKLAAIAVDKRLRIRPDMAEPDFLLDLRPS